MTFKLFDEKFREPTALVGISLVSVVAAGLTAVFSSSKSDKLRSLIVQSAVAEPWQSPRINTYWKDVLSPSDFAAGPPKEWCGALALWSIHRGGIGRNLRWVVGSGFLSKLPTTTQPKYGDIAYFDKLQHQAIVRSVTGNKVTLINGNGAYGKIVPSTIDKSLATAYFSIEPLIQEAIA